MSPSDSSRHTSPEDSKRGLKRKRGGIPVSSSQPKEIALEAQSSSASDLDDSGADSGSDAEDGDFQDEARHPALLKPQVLSHAAQRKLKKKVQKEAMDAKRPASLETRQNDPAIASRVRQNSVWVGNLAFKTTGQALRVFFQRGVPGCKITRVNLPTKTGRQVGGEQRMRVENRGFAYVDFATVDDKKKAIALSEQHLDGRKLLIKDGVDFTGRPTITMATDALDGPVAMSGVSTSTVGKSKTAQRILAAQKQPPAPTLFMGNLGFQANEQSIREMIEGHMERRQKENSKEKSLDEGEDASSAKVKKVLKKVRLGTFEDSGHCKGFAFLDFATVEDATSVLANPQCHHLDGRKLVVEYASADAVRRGGGPGAKKDKLGSRRKDEGVIREPRRSKRGGANSKETPTKESRNEALEKEEYPAAKRRKREGGRQQEDSHRGKRTRPGAALALAQREKVAIVPSNGTRIVF